MSSKFKSGTFTSASGGAESIDLGFAPDKVVLFNQNATTNEVIRVDWYGSEMGDGKEFKTFISLGASYAASGGNIISATTSSPSVSDGKLSFSGKEGFTIDADFLDSGDVCWWEANQDG